MVPSDRLCFQQSIKKRSAEPCRGKFELGIGQGVRPHHGLQSYDPEVTVAGVMIQSHRGRSHDPESQKSWRLTVAGAVAQSHS